MVPTYSCFYYGNFIIVAALIRNAWRIILQAFLPLSGSHNLKALLVLGNV
jgi:hypothetical protein